jgi:hypothetical protein
VQAKVHRFTEDVPGEIRFYDQAAEILERLVNQEDRWELSDALASLYMNKATAVNESCNGYQHQPFEAGAHNALDELRGDLHRESAIFERPATALW